MARHVGLLGSAARAVATTSPVITVAEKYDAAHVVVDVTDGTGFEIVVDIKGKDQTSGKSYTILTSSKISATGTTVLKVGPQYTAGTNVAKDYIPYNWYVEVTPSGGVSATYSVGASLI
jgi:hypothetical protein